MKTIHDAQVVLDYIIQYKKENEGFSPSVREISESCKIPSSSNVQYILRRLERDGKITMVDRKSRIMVPGGKWIYEEKAPYEA